MTAARYWRASVWLGLATLVLGGVLLAVLPRGREGLPAGFMTPIVAFEFASTETEVRMVLAPSGETPDRGGDTDAMRAFDRGNRIDFAFLLAYGGFLACAALAISKGANGSRPERRARVALPLSVLASAADSYENIQLLSLTAALRDGTDMTAALHELAIATWVKWGSLLVAFYALAAWLWRSGAVGKAVSLATGVGILAAATTPAFRGIAHEVMANAVFAMFIGLWAVALQQVRRSQTR